MNMTREEAEIRKKELNDECDEASKALQMFERNTMGLVPDHVRETQDYQDADKRFKVAFARLREFNGWYVKEFRKKRTGGKRKSRGGTIE
ncbi:hypothetical protein ACTFR8_22490 [Bacillus cereus group sp. MYBK15-3]|uniref:hypothetical protein n=1 Tax=Bacillus cereus group TaxID=86661 RepID=UPI001C8C3087|nr:hypothetical protein [Bacillus cereus]MBX9158370.1 hypothetical protein [Bacillus cereus]